MKAAPPQRPSLREQQAEKTRRTICEAAILCLDEEGYAETSLARIEARAGVSRGALTHHFPTKEDLIATTLDMLLGRSVITRARLERQPWRAVEDGEARVRAHLRWLWERLVRTREGRALIEILIAARTDKALNRRTGRKLVAWNRRIGDAILEVYESPDGTSADVVTLWTVCRVFLRGMILHERFTRTRAEEAEIVDRFISLVAPHLRMR